MTNTRVCDHFSQTEIREAGFKAGSLLIMPSNEVYSKPENVVVFYQLPPFLSISILKRTPHSAKGLSIEEKVGNFLVI